MDTLQVGRSGGGNFHPGPQRPAIETIAERRFDRARPVSRSPQTTLRTPGGKCRRGLGQYGSTRRRRLRRLDDHRVPGRYRRRRFPMGHLHGVVPGVTARIAHRLPTDIHHVTGITRLPLVLRAGGRRRQRNGSVRHRRDFFGHSGGKGFPVFSHSVRTSSRRGPR